MKNDMDQKIELMDICGYGSRYKVSKCGKIYSDTIKRFKKTTFSNKGYEIVCLSILGVQKGYSVHRLVAELFVPNPEKKDQVNHKDGNKRNNNADNLEWVTGSENQLHARKTGLNNSFAERCNLSKITSQDVDNIRRMYSAGYRQTEIAFKYNLHQSTISLIVNNKTWK